MNCEDPGCCQDKRADSESKHHPERTTRWPLRPSGNNPASRLRMSYAGWSASMACNCALTGPANCQGIFPTFRTTNCGCGFRGWLPRTGTYARSGAGVMDPREPACTSPTTPQTVRNGWAAWGRPNWICFPVGSGLASFAGPIVSADDPRPEERWVHPDPKASRPCRRGTRQCWGRNPGAHDLRNDRRHILRERAGGPCPSAPEIDPVPRPSRGQAGPNTPRRFNNLAGLEYFRRTCS